MGIHAQAFLDEPFGQPAASLASLPGAAIERVECLL
jgi:hypothetical protein